jgi:transposase
MSFPGIGFTSAITILAEIGNYRDFKAAEKLASWCGLVPSAYQSADKLVTGCITKRGSRHIRWILVEVAHAIARTKNSELKRFFLRIRAKKGNNVAIVALARKVLCLIHHLLTNSEMYEDGVSRKGNSVVLDEIPSSKISLREMIDYLVKAGYE